MSVIDRYTPLSPGQMTQTVRLLAQTKVIDDFGQHEQWTDLATVYAKVDPLQAGEFFAAGATQNPASLRVSIYWRPNLTADLRLVWMGVTYELTAAPIDVHGERQSLELMCREISK